MRVTMNVADATAPTNRYQRARVIVDDTGIEIQDRRGRTLAKGEGTPHLDDGTWVVETANGTFSARPGSGCGCKGTQILPPE